MSFQNMRVDGAIELENGNMILIEVKFALNWKNSCNARIEIQRFNKNQKISGYFNGKFPSKLVSGALIVFNRFSGDWNRQRGDSNKEMGWFSFYEEECEIDFPCIPLHIVRLDEKGFTFF